MTAVLATQGAAVTAAPSPPLAARTQGLRKRFRGALAVDGVDLAVPSGSVLGLLGPNGSGKTTIMRMLLGLSQPTDGLVELLGQPMPDSAVEVLPHVGALIEAPGFFPYLSGRDNLLRCAAAEPSVARRDMRAAVADALERVGLTQAADRRFKGYSLGMKQRLGLAAALLVPRELVVLDEPTNGLDPAGTRDIRRVIAEMHAEGVTVIVSSHLLAEVEATCTHVAVLKTGGVVAQGPLVDLLESPNARLIVVTPDAATGLTALRDRGVRASVTESGLTVELTGTTAPEVVGTLVNGGVAVHEARRERTGLEDLFAELTETGATP